MSSLTRHAGELTIDHRDSPGIPDYLAARWSAMGATIVPAGQKRTLPAYTCRHCTATVVMRPERTRPRAVCRKCMAVVCDRCESECQPFDKIADSVLSGRAVRLDPSTNLLLPT